MLLLCNRTSATFNTHMSNECNTCRIFPTAPTRPISVNMGMQMPGWFDIDHLDESSFRSMIQGHKSFDPEGIDESVGYVKDLIAREIEAGIPAERIVVGGFSQGGHIALKAALQHAPTLAGCVALSTWLEPLNNGSSKTSLATNLPIFHGHGTADPLIPITIAAATQKVFESLRFSKVESKFYPGMGHSSCTEEMADLKRFLNTILPDIAAAPPTREEVSSMSTRQLKEFLHSQGISTVGLLEKNELLTKALDSL